MTDLQKKLSSRKYHITLFWNFLAAFCLVKGVDRGWFIALLAFIISLIFIVGNYVKSIKVAGAEIAWQDKPGDPEER